MQMFGKVIGVFLGWYIGDFVGALLGLYIGYQLDRVKQMRGKPKPAQQAAFFYAVFSVMGHLAKAKGKVTAPEIQVASRMMAHMNLSAAQKKGAQQAFMEGKENDFPLTEILKKISLITNKSADLLQFFLEVQIAAAIADGEIHPNEREILHIIAKELGFSAEQLESRLRMQEATFRFQHSDGQQRGSYQKSTTNGQLKEAYNVLDINENADAKTIKRAYRILMSEHHPDKLIAKGLPPAMMNMAKEKTQEIQSAYDLIKKVKGIK